jgi:hypothetical protein
MSPHQEKSRILKAFTDRDSGQGFDEAQDLLRQCLVVVALSEKDAGTHAGQSAALTAIATAMKCFGQAALLLEHMMKLLRTEFISVVRSQTPAPRFSCKFGE